MKERMKEVCPGLYYGVVVVIAILLCGGFIAFLVLASNGDPEWGLGVFAGAFLIAWGLWVHLIISGYFYFAAVDKGYTDLFYLRLTFSILPVGALLIIALPDRGGKETLPVFDDELPDI